MDNRYQLFKNICTVITPTKRLCHLSIVQGIRAGGWYFLSDRFENYILRHNGIKIFQNYQDPFYKIPSNREKESDYHFLMPQRTV